MVRTDHYDHAYVTGMVVLIIFPVTLQKNPITYPWSNTCHIESHSVTRNPTYINTSRHNPSQKGQYSIYLHQRDIRLS